MEEVQARHRKEAKDLQGRVTQKKKQASKKNRKGINDECDRLEEELRLRHATEIAGLNGENAANEGLTTLAIDDEADLPTLPADTSILDDLGDEETSVPSQTRKPNRQKARLARRAAEQDDLARQAAQEAKSLPDMKQQERERMLSYMKEHSLQEKEIRADGHCLYSAVADQLAQNGISLGTTAGDQPSIPYKLTRTAAANYIESHPNDFAGFVEEPLPEYVHKIRDTAEWGGQLELQALAKVYGVKIHVLQDHGRIEKIEPEGNAEEEVLWLGYYKHGFGLGEHYNSLRQK